MKTTQEAVLDHSTDMEPVQGTVEVQVPAEELWREFSHPRFWPRWNRCFFWCLNRGLVAGTKLIWCFEPIRWWYLYKFPAIANIVEVVDQAPLRKVTWEVTALPGFYARHSYTVEDLGGGRSRFGSWEKACGWNLRLLRGFWLAHFRFVRDRSLQGAQALEAVRNREGLLNSSRLPRRSYLLFLCTVLVMVALLALLGAAGWFYFSFVRLSVTELAPGVYVAFGGGGNSLVVDGGEQVLLVDSKFPRGSAALDRWLRSHLSQPVTVLVNTHYHYDHTQGNVLYPSARIMAHEAVAKLMRLRDGDWWSNGREAGIPSVPVSETTELTVGRHRVRLLLPGAAHTQGDLVIALPDANIVATGDLVFHTYYLFFDEGQGGVDILGMVGAVRALAKQFPDATFVPGHGPLATREDLLRYADYLESLYRSVEVQVRADKSLKEAVDTVDLGPWRLNILPSFHNQRLSWATAGSNIRSVYRIISKAR